MVSPKVGFLAGSPGGNPTGIFQDYILPLDTAGIPAVVGCLDGDVGISDILALNSDVPHVMYFRVVRDMSEGTSVPEYHHPPDVAARLHWDKIRPHFPASVVANRDRIWITPINEPDVNVGDWLGWFSIEIGKLMRAEGFKQAAFGWAAGQPGFPGQETEFWETPGMLAYLRECERDPEYYGIALHEGSFTIEKMEWDGWVIGRFRFLHEACDRNGIKRPPILITEFAWEMNKAPSPSTAMEHLKPIAEQYAKYPNVLGIFLWCLCNYEDGKIANMVNKLIVPIRDFTLSTVFPDPVVEPEPPKEPPVTTTTKHLAKVHESTPLNPDATHIRVILSENVGTPEVSEWKRMATADIPIPASANPKQIRLMLLQITEDDEPGQPLPPDQDSEFPVWGLDVSWAQGTAVDFQAIAAAGHRFAFVRAGSGKTPQDDNYAHQWASAGAAGLLRGPYWYLYPGNAAAQAADFVMLTKADMELPPVVDVEEAGLTEADVRGFVEAFRQATGLSPLIYTRANIWNAIVPQTATWPAGCGLWIAAWPSGTAHVEPGDGFFVVMPHHWTTYDFWQWSSHGSYPGYTGRLDFNWYAGTWGELQAYSEAFRQAWANRKPLPPPPPIAGKFAIGDRVQVTAAAGLNVRASANGDLLGAQAAGSVGTITAGPQTDGNFTWWQVGYDTGPDGWSVENWLERAVETPEVASLDMLGYMRGDGRQYELKYTWGGGGTHPVQTQASGDTFYNVKGGGEYEELYYDDSWIYRGIDTSEAPDKYYVQRTGDKHGAVWCKRFMAVSESVTKQPLVVHYWKSNCSERARGNPVDTLTLKAHYPAYTFDSGITLSDVVFLEWNAGEGYYFARGYGLVGFTFSGGKSYISEIHEGRPDLLRTTPGCFQPGARYYVITNPLVGLKLGPLFNEPYVLTSSFNAARSYGLHEGADYDVLTVGDSKAAVRCTYDGVVDRSLDSAGGYGKYVRVRHERNGAVFYTRYAHLDIRYVAVGQVVKLGDALGEVGSTGNVTGEHVHFNLEVPGYGLSGYVVADVVDPAGYF